tara:strand:- start:458 stop:703 length:246 start_codon:yes stop_codon:yes gene_type:complete
MGEKKRKDSHKGVFIFRKKNYKLMFAGLLFIGAGFLLMSGGGSNDPNIYSEAIFSFRRIRLAPTLVIIGYVIQIYAILSKK